MDFSFTVEQLQFRDQLRAFAEKHCPPSAVREAWTSATGWSAERWSALAELGVAGLTVAEDHGGLGLGQVDLVLLLEEAGRACLPEPLLETVAVAVPIMERCSGANAEEMRSKWMRRVADGAAVIAIGLSPRHAASCAKGAGLLLLEHRVAAATELHGVEAESVELDPHPMLDGMTRLTTVHWRPSPASLIASGAEADALLDAARDHAANAAAAILLGLAQKMISMAAQYAVQRKQFGNSIGSFQAVKHHLANALVRVEFARPLVYRAAWSLDMAEQDATVNVSMAKAQASEAAAMAARVALQVHGAIGYTWEHDLQLWMKHAWALAAAWGCAASHRARVLEALVASATSRSS